MFLQETHVEQEEVGHMQDQHANAWGFRRTTRDSALSYWSSSSHRKGGVAILTDPYGHLEATQPCMVKAWNSHFMAITGVYAGTTILFIRVYAPHRRGQREAYYRRLGNLDLPVVDKIVVGGDFNCTMDPRLDRSWLRKVSSHDSPALSSLLAKWGLVDALSPPDDVDHWIL